MRPTRMPAVILAGLHIFAATASAATQSDQEVKNYLAGLWMIGKKPANANCVDSRDSDYQMEFEFGRTGGRLLYYKPFDVFTALRANIVAENGGLLLSIGRATGSPPKTFGIRILPPDRLELHSTSAEGSAPDAGGGASALYRCGEPDTSVNALVADEQLKILTAPTAEMIVFIQSIDGESDAEICISNMHDNPNRSHENGYLAFEVYGPVHYYVVGTIHDRAWHSRLDLSPIRSIVAIDVHTLRLTVVDRSTGDGTWRGGDAATTYDMTVIWDGKRITIPEMKTQFVRCREISGPNPSVVPAPL